MAATMANPAIYKRNRFFQRLSTTCHEKVPKQISADELNVVFGLGRNGALAAGAAHTFSVTAPRDLFVRDLIVACPAVSASVTSINVSGDELVLGDTVPADTFATGNQSRPSFDLPVTGGSTIKVTVRNDTAAALAISAAFNID